MQLPSFLTDFSLSPLEYHRLAREWSNQMRRSQPVLYDEEHGAWLVFRYSDTARVRSDYATFTSEHMVNEGQYGSASNTTIASMDPPRHTQMRSLVTQAFSARAIAQMAPRIECIVNELLDRVQPAGTMDWVADIAHPLPVMVVAEMLGLPREEWPSYRAWTEEIVHSGPGRMQAYMQFAGVFMRAVEERRRQLRQDVLSLLMAAEVDGQRLSLEEMRAFFIIIFVAGVITTTSMLGNAILCLDQHPEEFERLRSNPELLPSAIEEILRYMPPVRVGANDVLDGRRAKTDVCLSGQLIRKGERIVLNSLPANFDPAQFPDPDRFDIARTPNRHLSFGHGVHFCLGAPLARLELKAAIGLMLERLPGFRLHRDEPFEMVESSHIFGVRRLPVTFQAAS
jgi:cytochrome P450